MHLSGFMVERSVIELGGVLQVCPAFFGVKILKVV